MIFYFFLSNLDAFYCLLSLVMTSSTVLNKSGESEHPCIVSDLRRKEFNFSQLNVTLVVVIKYRLYSVEVCSLCTHLLRLSTINGC